MLGEVLSEGKVKVDASFRLIPGKVKRETVNYWAKVRVVKDRRRGEEYFDIVGGRKDKAGSHFHAGVGRDGSMVFMESRGKVSSINRRVTGKTEGLIEDKTVVLNRRPPEAQLRFTTKIDEPSRQVWLEISEVSLQENPRHDSVVWARPTLNL